MKQCWGATPAPCRTMSPAAEPRTVLPARRLYEQGWHSSFKGEQRREGPQDYRDIPSSRGSRVMAVLRRPLPRLTKCGFCVCTFRPRPISVRSRRLFCRAGEKGCQ